jgi:hypothetical protein
VDLLREAINKAGVKRTALAAAWGMSMPTFYSRISGNSEFTASEIVAASASLQLTIEQRDAIFLGD